MEAIIVFIQQNVAYAPFIIFGLLILAGFNIPVSEDLMLIISGILAAKNPDYLIFLFIGVFAGAYFSDLICYWMGRLLGPKIWKIQFFANMVSKEKVDTISDYYQKYGAITLFLGRFIPFGVRNGLFLTAGLGKMNFARFAFFDFLACIISNLTLFYLSYTLGEKVIEYVRQSNQIIFSVAVLIVLILVLKNFLQKRKKQVD